jgi:hypothetical protein
MKPTFWDYIRRAFNARPVGMFVPPNWIGLGVFGLLGLLNPGFWLIGAGLELGYLYTLSTNNRFRNLINGERLSQERKQWEANLIRQLRQLSPEDQQRYAALGDRGRNILSQQRTLVSEPSSLEAQAQGLARLQMIYLRLLLTRQSILRVLRESQSADRDRRSFDERIKALQEKLKDESLNSELRKSLAGQLEILQQRQLKQSEARDKLAYVEAELTRIHEQVELLREQAGLTTDPGVMCQRIDEISATLGGTNQWISEQQRIYGRVEDLLEPPAVSIPPAVQEEKQ